MASIESGNGNGLEMLGQGREDKDKGEEKRGKRKNVLYMRSSS
jgi:hypothetical protein